MSGSSVMVVTARNMSEDQELMERNHPNFIQLLVLDEDYDTCLSPGL